MDPQYTIGLIVTALGSLGGAIAWYVRRRDSQKDPIPKETAAVPLAQSGVALMHGVAERLDADLASVRAELVEVREEMAECRSDVQRLTDTLGAAVRYIERLLRWDKSETRGPRPPLPTELHDL